MTLEQVNLSTGPVNISREVYAALAAPTMSHRSPYFRQLMDDTVHALCSLLSVQYTFIMNGSGTLANEVMLQQIKTLGNKGLILSNGEFGSRLMQQATRIGIPFATHTLKWGQHFDLNEIKLRLVAGDIHWILFCHCETSTGILNDLQGITALCEQYRIKCFTDCMSSVGTVELNLSKVTMATASSGKGLGAFPGLALLFSNIAPLVNNEIPTYLDLANHALKNNIPFTISSNLMNALYTAIVQKQTQEQIDMIHHYSRKYYDVMQPLIPFSDQPSKVLTVVLPENKKQDFVDYIQTKNIILSHESEYLIRRNWVQLAVLGHYQEKQLQYAGEVLEECLEIIGH